jgi:hypothetical protein
MHRGKIDHFPILNTTINILYKDASCIASDTFSGRISESIREERPHEASIFYLFSVVCSVLVCAYVC